MLPREARSPAAFGILWPGSRPLRDEWIQRHRRHRARAARAHRAGVPAGHRDHPARACQHEAPVQARVACAPPRGVPFWDVAGAGSRDGAAARARDPVPLARASPVQNRAGRPRAAPLPWSRHGPAGQHHPRLRPSPLPSHLACPARSAQLLALRTSARPMVQRCDADARNAPPGRPRPRRGVPARQPRRGHSALPGSHPPSGQNPAVPQPRRLRAVPPRDNGKQNATAANRSPLGAVLATRRTSSAIPVPAATAGVLPRATARRAARRAVLGQTEPGARFLGHRACPAVDRDALPGAVPTASRNP